jgi:hypothetical protein
MRLAQMGIRLPKKLYEKPCRSIAEQIKSHNMVFQLWEQPPQSIDKPKQNKSFKAHFIKLAWMP